MKNKWTGITITKLAIQYIKSIIKNYDIQIIKIDIKKSGCAGFRYDFSLINYYDIKNHQKYYIYEKEKIRVYIPIKYMPIFDKTEIDLIIQNDMNKSIKFNNPKIKEFCGCGDSFYIKNTIDILPT